MHPSSTAWLNLGSRKRKKNYDGKLSGPSLSAIDKQLSVVAPTLVQHMARMLRKIRRRRRGKQRRGCTTYMYSVSVEDPCVCLNITRQGSGILQGAILLIPTRDV